VGKSGKSGFNQVGEALRSLLYGKAKVEPPTADRNSGHRVESRPPNVSQTWQGNKSTTGQRPPSTRRSLPLTVPLSNTRPDGRTPVSKLTIGKPVPKAPPLRPATNPLVKPSATIRRPPSPSLDRTTKPAPSTGLDIVPVHHSLSGGRTKCKIAAWVAKGRELQLSDSETVDRTVRIGLDFGTSFTKMAVGIGDETWVIDWRGLCELDDPCLVPSEACVLASGQFVVGQGSYAFKSRGGIKLPMLAKAGSRSNEEIDEDDRWVAAFLAVCLQYARAWIYRYLSALLRRNRIMWEVNLGIPVGSWDIDRELESRYQRLAALAWSLSRTEKIELSSANQPSAVLEYPKLPEGLQALNVVPEIVAQVAGYFESTQRKEGMHILMDIGGGTLDVACFYTHPHFSDDKHVLPIYSTEVKSLGTTSLIRNRLSKHPDTVADFHAADNVLNQPAFAEKYKMSIKVVDIADAELRRAVSATVAAVVADGQSRNQSAPEFTLSGARRPMRVFITGGGAKAYPYSYALEDAFKERRLPAPTIMGLVTRNSVNWPTDADAGIVDRVSVAIGLTRDIEDLRLLSPKAFTPVTALTPIPRKSSDDIYAK
jgi:hypothetical protein